MNIAILSTTALPKFLGDDHPNEESLFAEDEVLAKALNRCGARARRIPWRQRPVDWARFDIALVRSTWDYIDDLPGFMDALRGIERAGCRLVNPLATIAWNVDKRYLAVLDSAGVPVVPTAIHEPGQGPGAAIERLGRSKTGYVVKPVVGVGAFGTERAADATALARRLAASGDNAPRMVQPFVASVATEGEWSFVFGGGAFLYAALKTPKAGDYRVQVMYGATTVGKTPAPEDLAAAKAVYRALPVPAPFARIDMARMPSGRLALMEAELIEPQLYFFDVPAAADLVAEAVLGLCSGVVPRP